MAICVGYFEERWPRALRAENLTAFDGQDFVRGTGELGDLANRLSQRASYERQLLDREHLLRICEALSVGHRPTANRLEAAL